MREGLALKPQFVDLKTGRQALMMHGEPGADQHESRVQPHHGEPTSRSLLIDVPSPLSHFS
ncbi:hypothetical protein F5144DRAFT_30738 [Chaetomium tenue]|uniref:Uncharacterized protein n=1 Tax=Chaetomium tenue TaxID=1854479 RepID=A0ACB7PNV7_9PEZI|nr:hypothetical protein F5144DRAFT_30738 [Chaetomium globosum]